MNYSKCPKAVYSHSFHPFRNPRSDDIYIRVHEDFFRSQGFSASLGLYRRVSRESHGVVLLIVTVYFGVHQVLNDGFDDLYLADGELCAVAFDGWCGSVHSKG